MSETNHQANKDAEKIARLEQENARLIEEIDTLKAKYLPEKFFWKWMNEDKEGTP
jgi:predicted nuclease with TOPRIM domain